MLLCMKIVAKLAHCYLFFVLNNFIEIYFTYENCIHLSWRYVYIMFWDMYTLCKDYHNQAK